MSRYPVSKAKQQELFDWMAELELNEDEIEEKFIRGSGKGGQKINKSSNCVWLKHLPTGEEIKCQADRSRAMNRFLARRALCRRIEEMRFGKKSAEQQAREKIRRQKRKRSKRAKEKILNDKKMKAKKKENRKKVQMK